MTDTMRTADGSPIIDGMRVWDYNMRAGNVDLSRMTADGWFHVSTDADGRSFMNAERVFTRHPITGIRADSVNQTNLESE